jgi:MFS family permease
VVQGTAKSAATADAGEASAWSPLKIPLFRALWLATIASNIGTWMHDIGAGWLMTSLSPTPVMVALVQTATTLPILFLALPAGALADIVDRRRYLLVIQVWLASVAALLAVLAFAGVMTAWMLVVLTFAMGIGAAMMMPAWAAVTPEIVPRAELQGAIALNSMGMNVARAIGPAIAGVIVSTAGTGAVFALNAMSFIGVMAVLFIWNREAAATTLPAERFLSALRTGFQFARHHGPLQGAVIRGIGFFLFASAPWALLPLIAKDLIGGGPQTFGILVAAIGAGAILGALALPRLRQKMSKDLLVAGATVLYAVAMLALAYLTNLPALVGAMVLSGLAWIAVLSSLQVAVQLALPNWVRSRGLAVFMATFMGSMALGSLLWGGLAQQTSIATALVIAAAGVVLAIGLTWRWKIGTIEDIDLTPSMHWPCPATHEGVTLDRGPVMVTIGYQVEATQRYAFLSVIRELGKRRKRDGAFAWGILEDTDSRNHFIEYFMVESWLEHLRQHERVTNADRVLQDSMRGMLSPGSAPEIMHYIAPGSEENES